MSPRAPKAVAFTYVVFASLLMFLLQVFPWSSRFMTGVFNESDTVVYERLGSWIVTGQVPYLEIKQVYPPLDVVMTALPHLLPFGYRDSFVVMNFAIFWALTYVYWRNVKGGPLRVTVASVVLLGLPSVLYYVATFNDLWAAGAVLLAFLLLRSGRFESGIAVMATGVFFKSYPLFLLPVAFCWVASQDMDPTLGTTPLGRIRGYAAALVGRTGLRLVASAVLVAAVIGGAATVWTGTSWLTVPVDNYLHRNPESFAFLLTRYTPLDWPGALWLGRTLAVVTVLGALVLIPLQRFDNAVRVAIVVVIFVSMSLAFHSPHWSLWFMLLLCLIPISRPLLLLLIVYDVDSLLYWPLFSFWTPIETLRPLAREVWIHPIVVQCVLKFVLIGWLLRDAWRLGRNDGGARAPA